jgi:uncharacterized ferritin-like protein (DUF455 family)
MKRQGMRNKVKSTADIKINGINLALRANYRNNKIKIR